MRRKVHYCHYHYHALSLSFHCNRGIGKPMLLVLKYLNILYNVTCLTRLIQNVEMWFSYLSPSPLVSLELFSKTARLEKLRNKKVISSICKKAVDDVKYRLYFCSSLYLPTFCPVLLDVSITVFALTSRIDKAFF